MIDPVVLTPFVVLGVLLLLGFAGCDKLFDLDRVEIDDDPIPVPPTVYMRVRVPTVLTVTEIVYRSVNPGGVVTMVPVPDPSPDSTEGTENVFLHAEGDVVTGTWTFRCRVSVRENGATAQGGDEYEAVVDGSNDYPTAGFQASGTPSSGDFKVVGSGLD